jgi:hypothetical protein
MLNVALQQWTGTNVAMTFSATPNNDASFTVSLSQGVAQADFIQGLANGYIIDTDGIMAVPNAASTVYVVTVVDTYNSGFSVAPSALLATLALGYQLLRQ